MSERTIEVHSSSIPQESAEDSTSARGWSFLAASVLLSAAAQVFLKAGAAAGSADSVGTNPVDAFLEPMVVVGLALYALGTLLWLKCLTRLDLSLAYLVSALQYVLVFVAAKALFAETLSLTRLIGLAVILLGIVIVSRNRKP
jgi:drug/metabolite transporter (DMT)-like permease